MKFYLASDIATISFVASHTCTVVTQMGNCKFSYYNSKVYIQKNCMQKINSLIFTVLSLFLLFSCQRKPKQILLNSVSVDTTISQRDEPILAALPANSEKLKLHPITNGTDSFEFRFWLPKKEIDVINILCIRYSHNQWISDLASFHPKYPDTQDRYEKFKEIEIENYKHTSINPDLNINQVIDSLSILDLQNAPPNSEIETSEDGVTRYILEFSDKKNYRVIHYFWPQKNPKNVEFDKKFTAFIELIRRNYKIDF